MVDGFSSADFRRTSLHGRAVGRSVGWLAEDTVRHQRAASVVRDGAVNSESPTFVRGGLLSTRDLFQNRWRPLPTAVLFIIMINVVIVLFSPRTTPKAETRRPAGCTRKTSVGNDPRLLLSSESQHSRRLFSHLSRIENTWAYSAANRSSVVDSAAPRTVVRRARHWSWAGKTVCRTMVCAFVCKCVCAQVWR